MFYVLVLSDMLMSQHECICVNKIGYDSSHDFSDRDNYHFFLFFSEKSDSAEPINLESEINDGVVSAWQRREQASVFR